MTGAATATAAVPAQALTEALGPPGEPPAEGFGHVLEAEAKRASGEQPEAGRGARTAKAEGAVSETEISETATDDEQTSSPPVPAGEQQPSIENAGRPALQIVAELEPVSGDAESTPTLPDTDADGETGQTAGSRTTPAPAGATPGEVAPSHAPVPDRGAAPLTPVGAPVQPPDQAGDQIETLGQAFVPAAPADPEGPLDHPRGPVPVVTAKDTSTSADGAAEPEAELIAPRPGREDVPGRGAVERRPDPPALGWHLNREGAEQTEPGRPWSERPAAPAASAAQLAAPGTPTDGSRSGEGRREGRSPHEQQLAAAGGISRPAAAPEGDPSRAAAAERPRSANLEQLVDAARTVIRVAAREGRTIAKITLHPAELGSVEIRLRYDASGVAADVVTDSELAAHVLGQAAADLRRSLEQQGLEVLSLDIRHGGDGRRPAADRDAVVDGLDSRGTGDGTAEEDTPHTTLPGGRLPLPGSTVDFLA